MLWLALPTSALLVLGAAAASAYAYDQHRSGELLPGVRIAGVSVGGLDRDTARTAIDRVIGSGLDAPIEVRIGGYSESTTARLLGTTTDVDRQIAAALGHSSALPSRVWHRITGKTVHSNRAVHRVVDTATLETYVRVLTARVEHGAVDASIATGDGFVHVVPSLDGFHVDVAQATAALRSALVHGARSVTLPGATIPAKVHTADLATVILVRVGENKLYLYKDGVLDRTYGVATGMPQYPTPIGTFKIVNRLVNPTWVNPAKYKGGWGFNLPARIGPGPKNPLGTRALALNSPGVLIHGTSDAGSIGYNASHGCIRMKIHDVEELFPLVPAGTTVVILRAAPDHLAPRRSSALTTPDVVAGTTGPQAAASPTPGTSSTTAPPPTTTTTTTH